MVLRSEKIWEELVGVNAHLSVWLGTDDHMVGQSNATGPTQTILGGQYINKTCRLATTSLQPKGEIGLLEEGGDERSRGTVLIREPGHHSGGLTWKRSRLLSAVLSGDHQDKKLQLVAITKRTKFVVFANATGCYAFPDSVVTWETPEHRCICERDAPIVTNKQKDDVLMRQQRDQIIEASLRGNRRKEKIKLLGRIPANPYRSEMSEISAAWKINRRLAPILKGLNEDPRLDFVAADKYLEQSLQAIEESYHVGEIIGKRKVTMEDMVLDKRMETMVGGGDLIVGSDGLKAIPERKLVKVRADVLTDNLVERVKQTTLEAVLELKEVKHLQQAFHRMEFIPPLPARILRGLEARGEEMADMAVMVYQEASGMSSLALVLITEKVDLHQEPQHQYIALPRYFEEDTGFFLFPEMTSKCQKTMTSDMDPSVNVYQGDCPVKSRHFLPVWEIVFEEEKITIQRFLSSSPIFLYIRCPEAFHHMEKCEGACVVRLGFQCRLLYRGGSFEDGEIAEKMPVSRYINDQLAARTYKVIFNKATSKKNYRMTAKDAIDMIITLLIGFLTLIILCGFTLLYHRRRLDRDCTTSPELEEFLHRQQLARQYRELPLVEVATGPSSNQGDTVTQTTEVGIESESLV